MTSCFGSTLANAVRKMSFEIHQGQTLALVGESGSGKSISALSIMRLLPMPPATIQGKVIYDGQDVYKLSYADLIKMRSQNIGIIFQDPSGSLNPILKVGDQIAEAVLKAGNDSPKDAKKKTLEIMEQVGIPDSHKRYDSYPHELSGGLNQRIMICQALVNHPKLLIADEPTTALDVTIQAQVLELIDQLKKSMKMAVLFITHNLALAYEHADEVCVMYAGEIIEKQKSNTIFEHYKHPYTKGLLEAIPSITSKEHALKPIPGTVPSLMSMPTGCRFHPRCPKVLKKCEHHSPLEFQLNRKNEFAKCWLYEDK